MASQFIPDRLTLAYSDDRHNGDGVASWPRHCQMMAREVERTFYPVDIGKSDPFANDTDARTWTLTVYARKPPLVCSIRQAQTNARVVREPDVLDGRLAH